MKNNFAVAFALGFVFLAAKARAIDYDSDARVTLPNDYREWVFLSSGIGMSYSQTGGQPANPNFDNVFVNPEAYRSFLQTGAWPDKTVLLLEIRASDSKVSINKDGRVQTSVVRVEAHIKDAAHGGWAFYNFGDGSKRAATRIPKTATCYSCHQQNGAVDTTFVQFYPTLAEIAKAKGTFAERPLAPISSQPVSQ